MRLSIFVFLAVIFISCNSTGSEPDFEPYRIGTWLVDSPETANWEGVSTKAKRSISVASVDSINLDQPGGGYGIHLIGMPIEDLEHIENSPNIEDMEKQVTFVIHDSTLINEGNWDSWSVEFSAPFIEDTLYSLTKGFNDDVVIYQKSMEFNCDSTYHFDSERLKLRLTDPKSSQEKVFLFNVGGAIPTISDLLRCS